MNVKKMTLIGMLTALYVVLSFCMKFTIIGNIQIDLGYIVLAIACGLVGPWAGFVGAVGCGIESLCLSSYGFSISWFVANLIIGIGCGLSFKNFKNIILRSASTLIFVFVGVFTAKTLIECYLYSIPLAVKIPKNSVAFLVDFIAMMIGVLLLPKIEKIKNQVTN